VGVTTPWRGRPETWVTEQTGDMGDSGVKDAVAAIIRQGDRFLFVKRSEFCAGAIGYWCPVSGRVEPGESQREALAREVMEEVGLHVVATGKVGEFPILDGRYLLHYWTTEIVSGEARIASPEVTALTWATVDELRQLTPTFEDDLRMIEEAARSGWALQPHPSRPAGASTSG
jgi:8-oxo-dGTP diphosphatase